MVTAAWIAALVTALCWVMLLRLTVRVFGRGADNGWDNTFAYAIASVALLLPAKWMLSTHSWILIAIAPGVMWVGQTIALKLIYEVRVLHAILIGVTHTAVTSFVVTGLTLVAGVVAAYVLYGKIISDPMILIRIILRLIGLWSGEIAIP